MEKQTRIATSLCAYLGMSLVLSACLPHPTPPMPTTTPTLELPTTTATFAFPTLPPTATPTPTQRPTATADIRSALGEVIYEDDFSKDRGWEWEAQESGGISFLQNRLVIALHESDRLLFALKPDLILKDFFLEVDARADLCQAGDVFGVMYRVNDKFEHYRFTLTCEGTTTVIRILTSDSRALLPLTETSAILPGPMMTNHLSLMATGDTFRFWINDLEIFETRDIKLPEGEFGLFVRSGRGNLATVSFSNLRIHELRASPVSTATPSSQE
jgi:hypothetical protein